MPDTTPIYRLPYPLAADPPDGAAQIEALAQAVEARLIAQLQHVGSHGTWTRNTQFSQSSAKYLPFDGASLSEAPAGTGYAGDPSGVRVPFDGVYLMMGQVRIEGPSTAERIQLDLLQGPLGGEVTVSTEQVKHDPGSGSFGFTISGRASMMDAGDYVRLRAEPIGQGGRIDFSQIRVQAVFLGNGATP